MEEVAVSTTWTWIFLCLYIVYCLYWGLRGYFTEKTSSGYTIAGRSIPMIAFLMAATAASFSGWTTVGHPGLIWVSGLAYAFASFYVLTIPITGTFFAKRNWLMGKRYGFVTPGDMYAYYYNNEGVRWLVVLTAVLYGAFYSAVQFMAAGYLFDWVTGFPKAGGGSLHGGHRLVLRGHRGLAGQHLGRSGPVRASGPGHHPGRVLHLGPFWGLDRTLRRGR